MERGLAAGAGAGAGETPRTMNTSQFAPHTCLGRTIINKRGLGLHYLVVQRGISAGHGRL